MKLHVLFSSMYPQFALGQQDAQEALTLTLLQLHEASNEAPARSANLDFFAQCPDAAYAKFCEMNNSEISRKFFGIERSTLTCNTCGGDSITWHPFNMLSVPLRNTPFPTLDMCLADYFAPEDLKWFFPTCQKEVVAKKELKIDFMPVCLIIHLVRWKTFKKSSKKVNKNVLYPDRVDVSPILSPDHDHYREPLYELRAVLEHDGSVSRGHYTNLHIGVDTNWGTDNVHVNENVRSQSAAAYVLMYIMKLH